MCSGPQLLLLKRVPSTDPYAPGAKDHDGGPLLGASAAHYTARNKLRRAVTAEEMLAAEVYDVRRRTFDSYEASLSMGKLAWLIPWYGQVMHFRQWADGQRSQTPPGTVHPVLGGITGVPETRRNGGRSP
ncbi:MAG TPA: hypothetical protein VFM62_03235 [Arthrobacter sp.]|nr:hypothetical protein [Arthrobacter sp.]